MIALRIASIVATIVTFAGPAMSQTAVIYSAGTYTQVEIPGARHSIITGINDAGQMIVSYNDSSPFAKSVLYSAGTFTEISLGNSKRVFGINDSGQMSGTDSFNGDSFIYNVNGTYTTIPVPAGTAYGINDKGDVVGTYTAGGLNGFAYQNGVFTTLKVGSFHTEAFDINDKGQIVGTYFDSNLGRSFGFLFENGVYTVLDAPGFFDTQVTGINNLGQIVGRSVAHSFLYENGTYTTIANMQAFDINDSGQIVGVSSVPEPSTWAMLLIGFVGLAFASYRRSIIASPTDGRCLEIRRRNFSQH